MWIHVYILCYWKDYCWVFLALFDETSTNHNVYYILGLEPESAYQLYVQKTTCTVHNHL